MDDCTVYKKLSKKGLFCFMDETSMGISFNCRIVDGSDPLCECSESD